MPVHPLDTPVFINQGRRALRSYTGTSRHVIGSISHQTKDIYHLFHPLYPEMVKHLRDTPHFRFIPRSSRFIHENFLAHQLRIILIRRDHIHLKTLLFPSFCQSSHHVIRLESVHGDTSYPQPLDNFFDIRNRLFQVLRHGRTLCLILREHLVTECRSLRIKNNSQMCRLLQLQNFQQKIKKTESSRCIYSRGSNPGIVYKRVIRTVNQCKSIQQV